MYVIFGLFVCAGSTYLGAQVDHIITWYALVSEYSVNKVISNIFVNKLETNIGKLIIFLVQPALDVSVFI